MKIGIVGDIHGNHVALRKVLCELYSQVQRIFFLGDLCGYYPFLNECVDLCRNNNVIGIRGNHDQILIECIEREGAPGEAYEAAYGTALRRSLGNLSAISKSWIASLPEFLSLHIADTRIAMYHGAPWNSLKGRVYPDFQVWERFLDYPYDIFLLAHTHYPFARRINSKLIINPGSVGQPRDMSSNASYGILDLDTGNVEHRRVLFDPDILIRDALLNEPHNFYLVEVLRR